MAATTAFQFSAPAPREHGPELHLSMKRPQEKALTPQNARRALMNNSWDDIVAGRKLLKASLNADDLNLLLESIDGTVPSPASLSRFLKTTQESSVILSSSSSGVPAGSASSAPASDIPLGTSSGGLNVSSTIKIEGMLPSLDVGTSKLDQEYEVIASSLHDASDMKLFGFDAPAPFYNSADNVPHSNSHAVIPPEVPPPSFAPLPELGYGMKNGITMMDVNPVNVEPVSIPQWNLTCRGKEYLMAKQQASSYQPGSPMMEEHVKSKCFSDSTSSSKHVNRKSNHIKTYKCTFPECGKTFITRKEQQNHIARHSSEPRFFCEYPGCSCKYTTKSSLDLHVTRIHGDKKYKCDLCDERYSVRGDLNQHMKRKHNKIRKL
jgi:hypothetical protein